MGACPPSDQRTAAGGRSCEPRDVPGPWATDPGKQGQRRCSDPGAVAEPGAAASALLFLGWADPAEGWLSAKLFEYLGAGRPILAVGPQGGDASRILHECGLADLTEDPSQIADLLEAWIRGLQRSDPPSVEQDQAVVSGYTRRAQTERLARLLDCLAGSPA